jgi:hypothetical protein
MNARTDRQFFVLKNGLDPDGAPDRIHSAVEHDQQTVTQLFDDLATLRMNDREYDLPLFLQQLHGSLLVFLHLPRIANNIGKDNDSQFMR